MAITKEELESILVTKGDVEKISSISYDGNSLLTRIPVDIAKEMEFKKGTKIMWIIKEGKLVLEILKHGKNKKNLA